MDYSSFFIFWNFLRFDFSFSFFKYCCFQIKSFQNSIEEKFPFTLLYKIELSQLLRRLYQYKIFLGFSWIFLLSVKQNQECHLLKNSKFFRLILKYKQIQYTPQERQVIFSLVFKELQVLLFLCYWAAYYYFIIEENQKLTRIHLS